MSKHHHHPNEGHRSGGGPGSQPKRHGWFFYVAGIFLLLALIGFILSGNLAWQPSPAPAATPAGR